MTEQPARDAVTLAKQVGRGLRSALGVHGFEHGGFLIEGGKTSASTISPLLVRHDFPEDWRILLITPRELQGTHGRREIEAFADLASQERADPITETLCRLVLLGMLPALLERELNAFGESLYDFNRRVGALFQSVQGGIYANHRIEEIIRALRGAGVQGVGQSSWGPTIFAIVQAEESVRLCDWLDQRKICDSSERIITSGNNLGAVTA